MIRFRRIFDITSEADQRLFTEAADIFRAAFPHEPEAIDRIALMLADAKSKAFEPVLLVSLDGRQRASGIAFVYYFPDIRYAYLQYIASDPRRSARGIGAALFEAVRELLLAKRARGLFLDVPPTDPGKVDDKSRLVMNRRRLSFYSRYGLQEVAGTRWDVSPNPRNEGYLTTLLFDPLGRTKRLERRDGRRAVELILTEQYAFARDDPFVKDIVASFTSDPVQLKPLAKSSEPVAPIATRYFRPVKMVVAERHVIHHLREKGYVERPVRVRAILAGLKDLPVEQLPTRHFPDHHITAVHDPHLVGYLKAMSLKLDEKAIIYPEVFPIRRPERMPKALEDRAGYFCADTFTPVTRNAYPAARNGADVALTAASLVANGERFAYALCRPPGHHAERRVFGGFCFLNNSAIAAHYLSRLGKVALLDVDYHHGNGAQDIFYARSDVLTVSIHGHPRHSYPNFAGYADERGEGQGTGFNRNFPLEPPVDDARYMRVLEDALGVIRRFQPRYLVLSLGFDIMKGDPTGQFEISVDGMERIGRRIGQVGLPTLVVQEGGYAVRNLRVGARAFFSGLAASWY